MHLPWVCSPALSAQEAQVMFLDKQVTDEPLNKGGDKSCDEQGSLHPTAVLRGREWGLNSRVSHLPLRKHSG